MTFTAENLRHMGLRFEMYRKRGFTMIAQIDGPFACITIDGNTVTCENGFLGVDVEGHPYPIASHILEAAYDKVDE